MEKLENRSLSSKRLTSIFVKFIASTFVGTLGKRTYNYSPGQGCGAGIASEV